MNIITNKSGKIIHLGSMMLLPGESGELPKAYENNPIVSFLESRGRWRSQGRTLRLMKK